MDSGLSAADIMAMTRDSNGNGTNDWMNNPFIYLVWLALLGNGGPFNRNGNGDSGSSGGGGGRCGVTCSDLFEGFNNQDVNGQLRGITQGLCDGFYAANSGLMQGFHGVDTALCQGFGNITSNLNQGFNSVNSSISNLGYQVGQSFCGVDKTIMQGDFHVQQGFCDLASKLAECCCENRQAIAQVRYDMATQACDTRNLIQNTTRDLIDNQNAGIRSVLDFLVQNKLAEKDAQIAELQRSASQDRQNAYITTAMAQQTAQLIQAINPCPVPAYVVPNPNVCGNYGAALFNNNGCGCGSCC